MIPVQRAGMRALRQRIPPHAQQVAPRRSASDATSPKGTPPHTGASPDPLAGAESFGTSFYLILASFPLAYALYTYTAASNSQSPGASGNNPLTALIGRWSDYKDRWERRNALHTRAMEQAGHDRNLFLNTTRPNHIELRFPEKLSMGSPIAIPAGHTANIDDLVNKYRNKAFDEEAEKMERLRKGEIEGQREYRGP